MTIKSRAPVRVDFAGAWTDVPYFSDAFGGATCNAAIKLYVRGELDAHEETQTSAKELRGRAGQGGELGGAGHLSDAECGVAVTGATRASDQRRG